MRRAAVALTVVGRDEDEIAAEAPNVALAAFGEGAKTRDFRTRAQTIAAERQPASVSPICPATLTIAPSRAVWTCTRRTVT